MERLPVDNLIIRLKESSSVEEQISFIDALIKKAMPQSGRTVPIGHLEKIVPALVQALDWTEAQVGHLAAHGLIEIATRFDRKPKKMAFEELKNLLVEVDRESIKSILILFHDIVDRLGAKQLRTLHDTLKYLYDEDLRIKKKKFGRLSNEQKAINALVKAMEGATLREQEVKENMKKAIMALIKIGAKVVSL